MKLRRLRLAAAVLAVVGALSGCAADPLAAAAAGGALDAQAAAGAQQEAAAAKAAAARVTLVQVAQESGLYAQLNGGSTSGFAAEFSSSEPTVAGQLAALTDTQAQIAVGGGQCVTVSLPDGALGDATC